MDLASGDSPPRWIVIDAAGIDDVDFTGGKTIAELVEQLGQQGVTVAFADVREVVRREIKRYGAAVTFFDSVAEARVAFHADRPT